MILSHFYGIMFVFYMKFRKRSPRHSGYSTFMKKTKIPAVHPAWEIHTFRDLLDGMEARYADRTAFIWRDADAGDGVARRTYADMAEDVRNLAAYLCAMGLEGKHIAVCGRNSYLWEISYLAVGCGVGVAVPLDRELRGDEITDLLRVSDCAAIIYDSDTADKLDGPSLSGILRLPLSLIDSYLAQGAALRAAGSTVYENHKTDPDAPGVLLYTSGTVGAAKGVMLSQRNICTDVVSVCERFSAGEDDCALSHLPLHHAYECTSHLALLYSGACIALSDSLRHMPADLSLFRPTLLITVPAVLDFIDRFIRKSYADARGGKILLGFQRAASGIVAAPMSVLSKSGGQRSRRSIYSTVHHFFGGRLRAIIVGAAPLSPEVFRRLEGYGYTVRVGYGLTECAPISLMQSDLGHAPDDVGFPLSCMEARIDNPDRDGIGELCLRGGNVMLGYYKDDAATAQVLRDGWLHTGDLARQKSSGTFSIVGRIKSMIVTPTGKKIYPEELELHLTKNPLVRECLVYAEEVGGTQSLCAEVYPDIAQLIRQLDLTPDTDLKALSEDDTERAKELLLDTVRTVNNRFPPYKHIKRLLIRKTEFDKTASNKLRREAGDENG